MIVGPIGYRPTSCFFLLLLLLQSLSSSSSFPHFYLPQTPQPIHFPKAYDNSYSKTNREHKYKDKDESSRITSIIFPHNLRNVKTLKRKQFYIFWLESPFSSSYSLSTDVHHLCPPQMLDAKGNCQCRLCLCLSDPSGTDLSLAFSFSVHNLRNLPA